MTTEINTMNKFMVGATTSQVTIMIPPVAGLSKEAAFNLAAYLVTMAEMLEPHDLTFEAVLNAIQHT